MRRQQPHRREVDRAFRQQVKSDREAARNPRGFDAAVGFVFGQGDELGGGGTLATSEADHVRQQVVVLQSSCNGKIVILHRRLIQR
jgi:hypothetical protein